MVSAWLLLLYFCSTVNSVLPEPRAVVVQVVVVARRLAETLGNSWARACGKRSRRPSAAARAAANDGIRSSAAR